MEYIIKLWNEAHRLIYEPRLTKSAIKRLADFIKRQAPIRRALKKAAREEKKRKEAAAV